METNKTTAWIEEEQNSLGTQEETIFEKRESLKLEENKVVEITVDFTRKWDEWLDKTVEPPKKKAIIRVLHEGVVKNFWLSKRNPLYRELLEIGKASNGTAIVKIMRVGQAKATKYLLVK